MAMYVCACHSLTDQDIRKAQETGAVEAREVFWAYGIKEPLCECCLPEINVMLCQDLSKSKPAVKKDWD